MYRGDGTKQLPFILNKRVDNMYKTCSRCGIVPENHICPYRTYRKKERDTQANRFRSSKAWTNKSKEIKEKSKYLCEVCIENKYHTINQFNFNKLETHHIEPLCENYTRRLDNFNLVVLCNYHHKLAENNIIPRYILEKLTAPECNLLEIRQEVEGITIPPTF